MSYLLKVLKERLKVYVFYFLIIFIFFINFLLFRLPLFVFFYAAALSFILGLIVEIFYLRKLIKRHERLKQIENMTFDILPSLQEEIRIQELDLILIIENLRKTLIELTETYNQNLEDTIEYFSTWIHQIKTPITGMKLVLEDSDLKENRILRSQLFEIERYVSMVLTYVRLESTTTDYYFNSYSLDELIKETLKKYAPEFILKKISLDYKETTIEIITDDKWFLFALDQIISNALKYTPKGSIKIFIEGDKLHIKDTGIGISESDLPRIFEKGFTGFNGRIDKKASGIGLYLTRRVLKNLGLDIYIDSKVGEGTDVIVNLNQYQGNLTNM